MVDHLIHLTGVSAIAFAVYLCADQALARLCQVRSWQRRAVLAATFALLAWACIHFGHEIQPGIIIDARGATIAVATVAGGPVVGAAATAAALLTRWTLGGAGMTAGLAGIVLDFLYVVLFTEIWRRHRSGALSHAALLNLLGIGTGGIEAISLRWIPLSAGTGNPFLSSSTDLFLTQWLCTLLMGGLIFLQRERHRTRALFDAALASSMDGFVALDPDGRITEVNSALAAMTGYHRSELRQMGVVQLDAQNPCPALVPRVAAILKGLSQRHDARWRRKDGTEFDVEIAVIAAPATVGGVFAFIRDVTDRKKVETALRTSEQKFATAFQSSPDAFLITTLPESRIVEVNDGFCLISGYTRNEVLGRTTGELNLWADLNRREAYIDVLRRDGRARDFETQFRVKSGVLRTCHISGEILALEGGPHFLSVVRDITESKTAQAQRLIQDARLSLARETAGVVTYEIDLATGTIRYFDPIPGLSEGQDPRPFLNLETLIQRVHPEDRGRIEAAIHATLASSVPFDCDYRIALDDDGAWHWMLSRARTQPGPDGRPALGIGATIDITELRRTQEQARRWQRIFETAEFGVACTDPASNTFVVVNPAFARQRGYAPEELAGRPILDIVAPECHRKSEARRAILDQTDHVTFETLHIRRDGSRFPVQLEVTTLRNAAGSPVSRIACALDITERKRAEAELHDSQRRLEQLVAAAQDGIIMIDPQGRISLWNMAATRIFGYTATDALGQDLHRLLTPPESQAAHARAFPQFQADGSGAVLGRMLELTALRRDRTPFQIELTVSPVQLGNAWHAVGIVRDITERKRAQATLENSERLQRLALRIGHIGAFEVDLATGHGQWSDAVAVIYGIPRDFNGDLAAFCWARTHPNDADRVRQRLADIVQTGAEGEFEFRVVRAQNDVRWVRWRGQALPDPAGKCTRIVGVNVDITDLRQAQVELEARVAQRTADLSEARDAADAANRAKSRFLANMSHEIRTPMNAILGFAQLMQRDPDLTPRQRHHLDTINRSGEHLLRLIGDVLDMSRIEAGQTPILLSEFNFRSLIEDMEAMFRLRTQEKGLDLQVRCAPDVPTRICTDAGKVRQVLLNILSNAVKFTARGSIRLDITRQPADPNDTGQPRTRLCLEVTDTGMGIAPEEIARVFEPFEQTQSGRHHGGTGLGMSISQELAQMLDGDITLASEPGRGSTFRFTFVATILADLPAQIDAPSNNPQPAPHPASSAATLRLPSPLRADLVRAVETGDMDQLLELITRHIAPSDPETANRFRDWAKRYNYRAILDALI